MIFGTSAEALASVVAPARRATKLPLIVKLSPNVTDIGETARAAEAEGADALSLVNTFVGMAVDVDRRRPVLANICGGLSGPAIRPLAVWLTWQCFQAVKIPLIGMGGIQTADDALEFMLAGASAVQVGTSNFLEPDCSATLVEKLADRVTELGASSIRELIGTLKTD
jgi:dihydroorotate dehydrogenase (NAD+) catalytic subunit